MESVIKLNVNVYPFPCILYARGLGAGGWADGGVGVVQGGGGCHDEMVGI